MFLQYLKSKHKSSREAFLMCLYVCVYKYIYIFRHKKPRQKWRASLLMSQRNDYSSMLNNLSGFVVLVTVWDFEEGEILISYIVQV